jgi:hypothetical protein
MAQPPGKLIVEGSMKPVAVAATLFALFFLSLTSASAQTAKDIVGTWRFVVNETTRQDGSKFDTYGNTPKGIVIFDAGGHFSHFIAKPDPVKFSSGNRLNGTPEEYKAAVHNSIAYYGTYKVDEAAKTITLSIEAATFPNWYGVTQVRQISIEGDELRFTNKEGSSGGSVLAILKRLN